MGDAVVSEAGQRSLWKEVCLEVAANLCEVFWDFGVMGQMIEVMKRN